MNQIHKPAETGIKSLISGGLLKKTENNHRETFNSSIRLTNNLIGKGGSGSIYSCFDDKNKEYAAKCTDISPERGIVNLLEASIMASYSNININKAHKICCTNDKLYIIQDKAIGDIEAIRSKEPLTITEEYLKKIKSRCLSIALGLYVLHNDDIIHADVKASNALVFLNGDKEIVKLCDFSISVKKWKKNSFFRHEVGTMTHRAPENLIKDKWNEKLDIWALACTFYEIAYGKKLFKYQGENIKDMDIVRKKTYNSILDWGSQNGQIAPENSYQNVDFTRSKYCREWRNSLMASFNDLLSNMLKINSKYRCNINEVLSHPFFDYKGSKTYFCYDNSSLQEDIDSDIAKYGDLDENVRRLCLELYQKSYNLDIDKKDKIETCIYVACKLTYNTKIEICKEIRKREDITALEIKLCQSLRFILHGVI